MFITNTEKYVLEVVRYSWGPGLAGEEKQKNGRGSSLSKALPKPCFETEELCPYGIQVKECETIRGPFGCPCWDRENL